MTRHHFLIGAPLCGISLLLLSACGSPTDQGSDTEVSDPPPLGWQCDQASYGDGVCDCGCFASDVDCNGGGYSNAGTGTNDGTCVRCHEGGAEVTCAEPDDDGPPPATWACDTARYRDRIYCDCGCGAPDPDCGGAGFAAPGGLDPVCHACYDATGGTVSCSVSGEWTCPEINYDDGLYCDCGCGIEDPDCDGAGSTVLGEPNPACQNCFSNGSEVSCPADDPFPATSLPADCRDEDRAFPATFPNEPPCGLSVGNGPAPGAIGGFAFGFYDASRGAFFLNGHSGIMRVDRATGDRTVLSGEVNDPATGVATVGEGPSWGAGGLLSIRQRSDGHIAAMTYDGFYLVDIETGERSLLRDFAGVPPQHIIRDFGTSPALPVGRFALGDTDDVYYVVVSEYDNNAGTGIVRLQPGGGEVVSISGAEDIYDGTNRGGGHGFALPGSVEYLGGALYVSNGLGESIMRVDPASGDRVVLTKEAVSGAVGESTDGYTHDVVSNDSGDPKLLDAAGNRLLVKSIQVDLATGDRRFASPMFRDIIEQRRGENAIHFLTGYLVHYDPATGIVYDVGGDFLRANELETGNMNIISGDTF